MTWREMLALVAGTAAVWLLLKMVVIFVGSLTDLHDLRDDE